MFWRRQGLIWRSPVRRIAFRCAPNNQKDGPAPLLHNSLSAEERPGLPLLKPTQAGFKSQRCVVVSLGGGDRETSFLLCWNTTNQDFLCSIQRKASRFFRGLCDMFSLISVAYPTSYSYCIFNICLQRMNSGNQNLFSRNWVHVPICAFNMKLPKGVSVLLNKKAI